MALPATTFRYQGATYGGLAGLTSLRGGPPDLDVNFGVLPYLDSAAIVDFNRDGLPDVVQSWEAEAKCFNDPGIVKVLLGDGSPPPDPALFCFRSGHEPKLIRSARPITGRRSTPAGPPSATARPPAGAPPARTSTSSDQIAVAAGIAAGGARAAEGNQAMASSYGDIAARYADEKRKWLDLLMQLQAEQREALGAIAEYAEQMKKADLDTEAAKSAVTRCSRR